MSKVYPDSMAVSLPRVEAALGGRPIAAADEETLSFSSTVRSAATTEPRHLAGGPPPARSASPSARTAFRLLTQEEPKALQVIRQVEVVEPYCSSGRSCP
jgi:hypothetical protein